MNVSFKFIFAIIGLTTDKVTPKKLQITQRKKHQKHR